VSEFADALQSQNVTTEKWAVFSFASADGAREGNKGLSQKRAETVKNLLCKVLDCDPPNGQKITFEGLGDNGVANSRSARIAVCVDKIS